MSVADIPILAMLKSHMGYLNTRQRVIAENVANADTSGYMARDLKPFSFQAQVNATSGAGATGAAAGPMAATQPGHMQPPGSGSGIAGAVKTAKSPDSEETLDGNGVVLEDQMIKLTDTREDFQTAVGLYQQAISMLTMAIRKPGAGS